jgi:hypothetical protein
MLLTACGHHNCPEETAEAPVSVWAAVLSTVAAQACVNFCGGSNALAPCSAACGTFCRSLTWIEAAKQQPSIATKGFAWHAWPRMGTRLLHVV